MSFGLWTLVLSVLESRVEGEDKEVDEKEVDVNSVIEQHSEHPRVVLVLGITSLCIDVSLRCSPCRRWVYFLFHFFSSFFFGGGRGSR